jgi:hypothetical protein
MPDQNYFIEYGLAMPDQNYFIEYGLAMRRIISVPEEPI